LELYVERQSRLHRLDPRTKLLFSLVGTLCLLATSNLFLVLGWLALSHALLLGAGVPLRKIGWAWRLMVPLLVLVPLLWPLFYQEGAVLLALGPVQITLLSLLRGVAVALRIAALAFVWFVLLFTTDQARLIRGLVLLGLPYSWGLTAAVALRYLPILQLTYGAVSDAQQARGLELGRGHFLAAARAQLPILVAVLIGALRSSETLALALQARAYTPDRPRSTYLELRLSRIDGLAIVMTLVLGATYLAARLLLGFGAHPLDFV
jgi:energy-coupling factor transport system permease protein